MSMRNIIVILLCVLVLGCNKVTPTKGKPVVVTTTNLIADIVHNIGGDFLDVRPLMLPGVDPHQYKASENDILKLTSADIIFYNGLNLEGKLGQVLSKLSDKVQTVAVSKYIPKESLLEEESAYDPHIWFDPQLWIQAVNAVTDALVELDKGNEIYYRKNQNIYAQQLLELDKEIRSKLNKVPSGKRMLITSHDAFSYFGRAYGWEVIGLQGINTTGETSVNRIQELVSIIIDHKVTCIFTETSVSSRAIDAISAAVAKQGVKLTHGNPLYSDSLGAPGSGADTYIGMMNANVDSIVKGILNE